MTRPKAYEPEQGYMFQILCQGEPNEAWEQCDYAVTRTDRAYMMNEYRALGQGYYKSILLPRKFWAPKAERDKHDATLPPKENWTGRTPRPPAGTQKSPFGPGA
jgi:hypothetical protein